MADDEMIWVNFQNLNRWLIYGWFKHMMQLINHHYRSLYHYIYNLWLIQNHNLLYLLINYRLGWITISLYHYNGWYSQLLSIESMVAFAPVQDSTLVDATLLRQFLVMVNYRWGGLGCWGWQLWWSMGNAFPQVVPNLEATSHQFS